MSAPADTEPDDQPGTRYEIKFEASGAVGKGEGPDALDVPEQPEPSDSATHSPSRRSS